jgi:hypothetical protein
MGQDGVTGWTLTHVGLLQELRAKTVHLQD